MAVSSGACFGWCGWIILLLGILPTVTVAVAEPLTLPKAARSVHLFYAAPPAVAFYSEVTVEMSQTNSYFEVCGFRHGYFGIQERRDTNLVLFSVWDIASGNNPGAVPPDQRATVLYQASDVQIHRFGGEGTGNQCVFPYGWRLGERYRFLIQAMMVGSNETAYAAYFYLNESQQWKHLATFATHAGGAGTLSGYYSFIEDFRRDGRSPGEPRRARFGNGWVKNAEGAWSELTSARFTADSTPLDNIDAGISGADFYLATGGDTASHTPLRSVIQRPITHARPPILPGNNP